MTSIRSICITGAWRLFAGVYQYHYVQLAKRFYELISEQHVSRQVTTINKK
jgi:hypothetical protein